MNKVDGKRLHSPNAAIMPNMTQKRPPTTGCGMMMKSAHSLPTTPCSTIRPAAHWTTLRDPTCAHRNRPTDAFMVSTHTFEIQEEEEEVVLVRFWEIFTS